MAVKRKSTKKITRKIPVTKKVKTKKTQTGTSNKEYDKRVQAKPVGKRKSKSGNTYYEYRANHTDKGKLLGIKNKKLTSVGSIPMYSDPDAVREITLYADNDGELYHRYRQPIEKNLSKKFIKGNFDVEKSEKLWKIYIENSIKKYLKDFGSKNEKWTNFLSVSDRKLLAKQYANEYLDELKLGNYTL